MTRQRTPSSPPPRCLIDHGFHFFALSGMRVWQRNMQAANLELISAQSLPWVCSKAEKPSSPTPAPLLILEIADPEKGPKVLLSYRVAGRWTQSLAPHVRRPSIRLLLFVFHRRTGEKLLCRLAHGCFCRREKTNFTLSKNSNVRVICPPPPKKRGSANVLTCVNGN